MTGSASIQLAGQLQQPDDFFPAAPDLPSEEAPVDPADGAARPAPLGHGSGGAIGAVAVMRRRVDGGGASDAFSGYFMPIVG